MSRSIDNPMGLYILDGKTPVPTTDVLEWGRFFEGSQRNVRQTFFRNIEPWLSQDYARYIQDVKYWADLSHRENVVPLRPRSDLLIQISTIFIGIDHNHSRKGDLILFETMVFNGPLEGQQWRYRYWDEAEAGHETMVARVKKEIRQGDEEPKEVEVGGK